MFISYPYLQELIMIAPRFHQAKRVIRRFNTRNKVSVQLTKSMSTIVKLMKLFSWNFQITSSMLTHKFLGIIKICIKSKQYYICEW